MATKIRNLEQEVVLTRGIKSLFNKAKEAIGEEEISNSLISHYEFLGEESAQTTLSPLERKIFDKFYNLAADKYPGANLEYHFERAGLFTTVDMKKATVTYINYMLKKRDIALRNKRNNVKSKVTSVLDEELL